MNDERKNPLDTLKDTLRVKPIVTELDENRSIKIVIPKKEKKDKTGQKRKIEFADDRKLNADFDIEKLRTELATNKLGKVTVKDTVKLGERRPSPVAEKKEPEPETAVETKTTKVKKTTKPKLTLVEEEDDETVYVPEKKSEKEIVLDVEEKPTERKTQKPPKGEKVLTEKEMELLDNTKMVERLPQPKQHVDIKVSSYYMNNREIFVNFINSLFQPYRDQIINDTTPITCESMNQKTTGEITLLTHQKLVRDYMNMYTPYRGLLVLHGLGSGKCQKKDTPIIMYNGEIKMVQDIKVGDLLMGDDSTPRRVFSLARGKDKMYEIIPIKGETYTVNQEHIMCLKASGFPQITCNNNLSNTNYNIQWIENNSFCSKTFTFQHKNKNQEEMKKNAYDFFEEIKTNKNTSKNIIEISVKDYLELSNKKKGFLKAYRVPIDFPEKELPIDPYMIGYWLGDGTSAGASFTSQDSTVLYYFNKNLNKYDLSLNHRNDYTYGITGNGKKNNNVFLNTLKELNMINNKHIPLLYKCNTRENRLKLLAGLIDSDGHLGKNGCFEFTQKNEVLMDDVVYLARSLGFACYKKLKNTSWKSNGIKKNGHAWRIQITGTGIENIPTLIPRKRSSERKQIKDALVTGITLKYVGEDEYYGFMLDGNSRYLFGDFTVTHNTATSIAVSEGMKSTKKIVIMTPASLRRNYIEEIKKYGDPIYKTSQYWEWISTVDKPELVDALSTALNLSKEYIERKKGAWLVNVKQAQSNIDDLMPPELKSLNEQIDEMIQTKYKFINYNGLRRAKLKEMTNNFETNIFDDSVVVIDEAHNLISRIVNKLEKEKDIPFNNKGKKERVSQSLSLILYELLMSASNARIVLLSGTPIINYPNEVAILFNMLRGYIKTWEFPLDVKGGQKVTKESLQEIFKKEKILDYMDYTSNNKKLIVTRNPFGFENRENKDGSYRGVTNSKKETVDKMTGKTIMVDRGAISDDEFKKNIIHLLGKNGIEVIGSGIVVHMYKALPDKFEDFINRFIEPETGTMKNVDLFKRRILGLTSYFKSASEQLLPRYEKAVDYHVIKIPMSDYQFNIYEEARQQERKLEKNTGKNKAAVMDKNGIYKESSSTYRIFSRLFCNFVVPRPPGRPFPERKTGQTNDEEKTKEAELRPQLTEIGDETRAEDKKEKKDDSLSQLYSDILTRGEKEKDKKKKTREEKGGDDIDVDLDLDEEHGNWEGVVEGDDVIDNMADNANEKRSYEKRIEATLYYLKEHADEILSPRGLETYSPKYLHMLENIQDEDHHGLHLVYSQFRTLEGIGIFKLVLEQNGFAQFKIKKNTSGIWELDIPEDDRGKPTFALYTGTESAEEKEVIRNIYNSNWGDFEVSAPRMYEELKSIANNNNTGEIIKVFMITASGSEGINLRNTRYVHIMEPYWHPARLDQVIGRARRICSHKDLPESLQTVEVFVYLMSFTKSQIDSDLSIELKNKDLSKKQYKIDERGKEKMAYIPLTSDEALFEISTIKEEVTNQLLTAVKESSIDCAIYSKRGSKENLHCIQFGQTNPNMFSYNPSISLDQTDTVASINKKTIEWKGKEVTISGKKYIYRKMNDRLGNLYDYDSYLQALEKPGYEPVMVGTVETNSKGQQVVKKV
uniref:DOD-type homing endonuclease domain-containing protein n=1 Tax=viral metagenome TaxID=1070528 RepID=A0A6C0H9C5_9ZZZZ